MNSPFFSIIIPTRNRYETLQYSIRTVLSQSFSDFELIISDNSDSSNLNELTLINEYLSDKRIKYCRPSSVLSMSDNWEFAVSKASGNYIIIFGDDDGLMAGSLNKIYEIIQQTKAKVISWARIEYSWPDRMPKQLANIMVVPYASRTGVVDSKKFIKEILEGKGDYRYLPMFYNSAVSKDLVSILKDKTGKVFNSACPDIYTGYAFAHLLKEYITIGYPLSINGVSSKSNGAAHLNEDESVKADYWKTFRTSSIQWPDSIPEIPTPYLSIIEPFVQLSKFFPELHGYITRRKIFKNILDSLEGVNRQDWDKKIEQIIGSAKDNRDLYQWVLNYIQKLTPRIAGEVDSYEGKIGFDGSHLIVDASTFGLKNVYDISVFGAKLLGNVKETNFLTPVRLSMLVKLKKAAGILLRD